MSKKNETSVPEGEEIHPENVLEDKKEDKKEDKRREYDFTEVSYIWQAIENDRLSEDKIGVEIRKAIYKLALKYKVDAYNILILFDEHTSLSSVESDKIYDAINSYEDEKDILLILNSNGGKIEPAYLISLTCKKNTTGKFVVAVPRKAKSAATLLALGADEIHMGLMSELGPIDPQINKLPALGLSNSLESIAKIVSKYPESANMFSQYLSTKLELNILGYFERVSESAAQYATRLLNGKDLPDDQSISDIAQQLVYHYKDHRFVIDIQEAKSLLGDSIVKENTKEYQFANSVYSMLNYIDFLFKHLKKKQFTFVGTPNDGLTSYSIDD